MLRMILGIVVRLLYVMGSLSFYMLWFYNEGRKDKLPKYSYYLFYPLHLFLLGIFAVYNFIIRTNVLLKLHKI